MDVKVWNVRVPPVKPNKTELTPTVVSSLLKSMGSIGAGSPSGPVGKRSVMASTPVMVQSTDRMMIGIISGRVDSTVEKLKEREEELPSYLEATGKLETVYEDAEHTDSPHTYLDELADSRTTSLVVHGTPNFQTTESSTTSRQNQRDASQLSSVIRRENETG